MKLAFLAMEVVNFKSFRGKHRLDLVQLGSGLHFLCGDNQAEPSLESNGAGKTSLIDAFRWCLTGKTSDGLKGPDIRPWEGAEETAVSLVFTIDAGTGTETETIKEHALTRTAGKGNTLVLDGQLCDQDSIDRLLQLSDEVIAHTMIFGQGKPLFFDLPPGEKLTLFSTVLALDRWDDYALRAGEKAKEIDRQKAVAEGKHIALTTEIEGLDSLVKDMQDKTRAWGAKRVTLLRTLQGDRSIAYDALCEVKRQHDEADLSGDGAGMELQSLREQVDKAGEELVRRSEVRVSKVAVVVDIKNEIDRLQNELDVLGEAEDCPTCGQSLKGTNLAKHKKELKRKIADLDDRYGIADEAEQVAADELDVARKQHTALRVQLTQFEQREDAARAACNRLVQAIANKQSLVDGFDRQIKELETANNPHVEQLQIARERLSAAKKEIAAVEASIEDLGRASERMTFWTRGMKEVRLLLVDDVLKELELVSNDMLQDVGLADWKVAYAIEKETKKGTLKRGMTVGIYSPHNEDFVKWEAFSGGERQRLRLVGSLALGEVLLAHAGVTANIEILDEPSQHLSAKGVKDLCGYLAWRADQLGKMIFLVDHQAVSSEDFRSTITVVRDDKGSRIVQ